VADDGTAHGFDLPAGNPTGFERLQAKLALRQFNATLRFAFHAPAKLLAIFNALWH
jgi:hypothetical protein